MSGPFALWRLDPAKAYDLEQAPRLANWDAKGSPAQRALQRYLDAIEDRLQESADPTALHLTVREDEAVGEGRDLDNFLYPVVHRLGPNRFDLAEATKANDAVDRLTLGQARRHDHRLASPAWDFVSVTSTVSSESRAWKEQIHEQISVMTHPASATPQPVVLEIAFRVGPTRTWANLWKPAIDSLGPIIGEGQRPFAPRDDTIVSLSLHREVVTDLGNRVELGVWWRTAGV